MSIELAAVYVNESRAGPALKSETNANRRQTAECIASKTARKVYYDNKEAQLGVDAFS